MSSVSASEAETAILKPGPRVVTLDIKKTVRPKQSKHTFIMDNIANNDTLYNIANYESKLITKSRDIREEKQKGHNSRIVTNLGPPRMPRYQTKCYNRYLIYSFMFDSMIYQKIKNTCLLSLNGFGT